MTNNVNFDKINSQTQIKYCFVLGTYYTLLTLYIIFLCKMCKICTSKNKIILLPEILDISCIYRLDYILGNRDSMPISPLLLFM